MRRLLLLVFAVLATAWTTAAFAADQPVYAAAAAWVKPIAIPKVSAGDDGGPTKVLLHQNQSRLEMTGQQYFNETASQVLSPQGLSTLGNLQQTWDPATETLVIHKLQILRDGKTIDLLAGGRKFTVLRRESNLDWAMLDGRLTANFQPEGLQVGDVLDFAYTIVVHDPVLEGMSTHFAALEFAGVASRVYFRTLWPNDLTIRWTQSDDMKPAVLTKAGNMTEVVYDQPNVEAPKPPTGAPVRFSLMGMISFSQYPSWNRLSTNFATYYDNAATLKPGSPVAAATDRIAAQTTDPKARTLAALRLVEDQVRYVFLGMNDGSLAPALADDTWSRKFGDCKGKTVLLIAVLRRLGIEAVPALVNTQSGDGIDSRLPTVGWFDHVIVRATVAGKTYWLDSTRSGDRSLDALVTPPLHWALPLTPAGSALEKLAPPPLDQPWFEQKVTIDASKGIAIPAKAQIVVVYHGESAVEARAGMAAVPRPDYERALRQGINKAFPWLNIATVDIKDQAPGGIVITVEGVGRLDWQDDTNGAKYLRVGGTGFYGQVNKRQPGPHDDAPYAVAYPAYSYQTWRVTLPFGPPYALIAPNIDRTLAGLSLKRTTKMDAGVLFVESTSRAVAPEFPASQVDADAEAMRQIGNREVVVIAPAAYVAALMSGTQKPPTVTIPTIVAPKLGQAPPPQRTSRLTALAPSGQAQPAARTPSLPQDMAAAGRGEAAAELRMSRRYASGEGVPIDPKAAMDWLQKAATAGDAQAQVQLGQAYANGKGVPADLDKSLTWFRKAADQGDMVGERILGQAYLNGESVKRDPAQAVVWLSRAAEQGDASAKRMLEDARAALVKAYSAKS